MAIKQRESATLHLVRPREKEDDSFLIARAREMKRIGGREGWRDVAQCSIKARGL